MCCRGCARPTAGRSRTRSSTSPTTSGASGCGRRSSRAATGSRSAPTRSSRLLERLSEVEGFERYLRTGVPRPEAVLDRGPRRDGADARRGDRARRRSGAHEVVIGMAHRGRLNVLAHMIGQPVRGDPARVRGRADHRRGRRRPGGRHRRRQVPPRRRGHAQDRGGRDHGHARAPTRATSRQSTRSSRAAPAPSRRTARRAAASTTRASRSRS